jgi:hypothetical protein
MSSFEIGAFTVGSPDSDGDMRVNLEVQGINTTDEVIRFTKTRTMFYNQDGAAMAFAEDESDVQWESDESFSTQPNTPWLRRELIGAEGGDITCKVAMGLYSREFHKLGEIDVPADHTTVAVLKKTLNSSVIAPDVAVLVGRRKPDGDGDIRVQVRCGITNVSDRRIDMMKMKVDLLDDEDSVIEDQSSEIAVDAGSSVLFEPDFWGLKKGKLKSTKLRIMLAVFRQVSVLQAEGRATPEE